MTSLAIVGAPRSGTRYLATVLASSGVAARHEAATTAPALELEPEALVDVSWSLLPHIPELRRQGVAVALVSRHPLLVLPSMLAIGFLDQRPGVRPGPLAAAATAFALRHLPELGAIPPAARLERLARFWIRWNRRALAAGVDLRIRIELLSIGEVVALAALAGVELERRPAARELGRTPRWLNTAGPPPRLSWAELAHRVGRELAGEVAGLGAELGHASEAPSRPT